MRRLYFLRHGLADRAAYHGTDDALRPLTAEGRRRMHQEAQTMAQLGLDPDVILSSPLTRAWQTAEIVAEELDLYDRLQVEDDLACGFGVRDLAGILRRYSQAKDLMLVGHEPDFSTTISDLTGGSSIICKKGSLARVDLYREHDPAGDLAWLLQPNVLTL